MARKNILVAAALCASLLAGTVAEAAPGTPPARKGPRATLFVTAGEKRLALEAPEGQCFLDPTRPLQRAIHDALKASVRKDQVMLAAFMDCNNISSPDAWFDGMPDAGFVTWLNPAIGATTPMSRADYLDMREATFIAHANMMAGGLAVDKKAHRDAANVSVTMASPDKSPPAEKRGRNILATTVVDQVPLEITVHVLRAPAAPELHAMMDKLVAQTITLNETVK